MLSVDLSPQVNVGEGSHPERVKVYGPGVEKTGLKANEPTYFTVDCSEAGQGASRLGVGLGVGPGRDLGRWLYSGWSSVGLVGLGREAVLSPSWPRACLPQAT